MMEISPSNHAKSIIGATAMYLVLAVLILPAILAHVIAETRLFKRSLRGRSAQGRVVGVIVTAAIAAIVLIVSVFIFSQVEAQINITDADANATVVAMIGDIYDAFGLSPVIILVLFAGIILAALIGFLAFRGA